jgi:hypothetical protein
MNTLTPEQLRELWEWCGWYHLKGTSIYYSPEQITNAMGDKRSREEAISYLCTGQEHYPSYPALTLDNLFEWAISPDALVQLRKQPTNASIFMPVNPQDTHQAFQEYRCDDYNNSGNIEIALALAIWQVIKEGN